MIGGVAICREVTGISVGIRFSFGNLSLWRSRPARLQKGVLYLNGAAIHYVVKNVGPLIPSLLNCLPAWQPTSTVEAGAFPGFGDCGSWVLLVAVVVLSLLLCLYTKEFVLSLYPRENAFTTTEPSTTVYINSNSGGRRSKIYSISRSYL